MFTSKLDEFTATLVCRYSPPYDKADYARYHAEFPRLIRAARAQERRAVLVIDIEDGYPQPNAVQRKEIGEAWTKAPEVNAAIAIITASTLIRGIITAIEWFLKTQTSRRETRAFARAEDAIAWLHDYARSEPSELRAALDAVRSPAVQVHP